MDLGPPSSPTDTGEEEARTPSSPSPRKRRRRTTRYLSHLRCPRCRFPRSLLLLLHPPYLPPLPSPLEGRKRPVFLCLLLGKGGGGAQRSSPSPRRRRRFTYSPCSPPPSSPHLPATPTHPLRPDVCIVVFPNGLIVVFFYFVRPAVRLVRCVRYSNAPFTELLVPWLPRPRGLLLYHMCYVTAASGLRGLVLFVAALLKKRGGQ